MENRGYRTNYRGPFLIAAGVAWFPGGSVDPRLRALPTDADVTTGGAILAVAQLAGCHQAVDGCCAPWGDSTYGPDAKPAWHWIITGARRLPVPVPARGALGLWTPPSDVVSAVGGKR